MSTFQGNVNDTAGYAEAFIKAYRAGYTQILQEMTDVYGDSVRQEPIEGESKAFDFIGSIELTEKASRFEDIPIEEVKVGDHVYWQCVELEPAQRKAIRAMGYTLPPRRFTVEVVPPLHQMTPPW